MVIDSFNNRLVEVNAPYRLDDVLENIENNFLVYTAKKKGLAKDEYPPQALMGNVKKINYERFSLSCFTKAFIETATWNASHN